jgi:hypothetical protein
LRGGLLLFLAGNGHGLGACQGAKERFEERSSPYRHQPVSRHLELRGAPLDGGSLVRASTLPSQTVRGDLVDAPA